MSPMRSSMGGTLASAWLLAARLPCCGFLCCGFLCCGFLCCGFLCCGFLCCGFARPGRCVFRACALVLREVCVHGDAGDGLAHDVEREVVEGLEADARLAHVELLPGVAVGLLEPGARRGIAVYAHQVEGHVPFLRGDRGDAQ